MTRLDCYRWLIAVFGVYLHNGFCPCEIDGEWAQLNDPYETWRWYEVTEDLLARFDRHQIAWSTIAELESVTDCSELGDGTSEA